jgi:hypothetical protein
MVRLWRWRVVAFPMRVCRWSNTSQTAHHRIQDWMKHPASYSCMSIDPDEWDVPSFTAHPLTVQYGVKNVAAIGFYTDKVKYSLKDTFIRCSVGCLWKRQRITSWVIKASVLCKCGCMGACTMSPIMQAFNASINALQAKEFWARRPDGQVWKASDAHRSSQAGELPMVRCAMVEYRADWPERAALAGCKHHAGNRLMW